MPWKIDISPSQSNIDSPETMYPKKSRRLVLSELLYHMNLPRHQTYSSEGINHGWPYAYIPILFRNNTGYVFAGYERLIDFYGSRRISKDLRQVAPSDSGLTSPSSSCRIILISYWVTPSTIKYTPAVAQPSKHPILRYNDAQIAQSSRMSAPKTAFGGTDSRCPFGRDRPLPSPSTSMRSSRSGTGGGNNMYRKGRHAIRRVCTKSIMVPGNGNKDG